MAKEDTLEQLTFDERCERIRNTRITRDMTYEERLRMQMRRYGLEELKKIE